MSSLYFTVSAVADTSKPNFFSSVSSALTFSRFSFSVFSPSSSLLRFSHFGSGIYSSNATF